MVIKGSLYSLDCVVHKSNEKSVGLSMIHNFVRISPSMGHRVDLFLYGFITFYTPGKHMVLVGSQVGLQDCAAQVNDWSVRLSMAQFLSKFHLQWDIDLIDFRMGSLLSIPLDTCS